jgi:hypothetical protein
MSNKIINALKSIFEDAPEPTAAPPAATSSAPEAAAAPPQAKLSEKAAAALALASHAVMESGELDAESKIAVLQSLITAPEPPPSAADTQATIGEFVAGVLDMKLPADVRVALIKRGRRGQDLQAAFAYAQGVRDICCAAQREGHAAHYVEVNLSIDTARKKLMQERADADAAIEIDTGQPQVTAPPHTPRADSLYQRRAAATSKDV